MSKITLTRAPAEPSAPVAEFMEGASLAHMGPRFITITPAAGRHGIRANVDHIITYGWDSVEKKTLIRLRDGFSHYIAESVETLDALLIGDPE